MGEDDLWLLTGKETLALIKLHLSMKENSYYVCVSLQHTLY